MNDEPSGNEDEPTIRQSMQDRNREECERPTENEGNSSEHPAFVEEGYWSGEGTCCDREPNELYRSGHERPRGRQQEPGLIAIGRTVDERVADRWPKAMTAAQPTVTIAIVRLNAIDCSSRRLKIANATATSPDGATMRKAVRVWVRGTMIATSVAAQISQSRVDTPV